MLHNFKSTSIKQFRFELSWITCRQGGHVSPYSSGSRNETVTRNGKCTQDLLANAIK